VRRGSLSVCFASSLGPPGFWWQIVPPHRTRVAFALGKSGVGSSTSPTLQWTAIGSNFAIDFPPFPVDALDRVIIEIPRGPVEQIRYVASSGKGQQAEGVLEKDENDEFPKEFRVKW